MDEDQFLDKSLTVVCVISGFFSGVLPIVLTLYIFCFPATTINDSFYYTVGVIVGCILAGISGLLSIYLFKRVPQNWLSKFGEVSRKIGLIVATTLVLILILYLILPYGMKEK